MATRPCAKSDSLAVIIMELPISIWLFIHLVFSRDFVTYVSKIHLSSEDEKTTVHFKFYTFLFEENNEGIG